MKPKISFLLRIIGCAVPLFFFFQKLQKWYFAPVRAVIAMFNSHDLIPVVASNLIFGSSIAVLTYLAFTLATPRCKPIRKVLQIAVGLIVFLAVDVIFAQYCLFAEQRYSLGDDSIVIELYLCLKWMLPFLLWGTLNYQYFRGLLSLEKGLSNSTG